MDDFSVKLQHWYELYHRKLPWRETRDPYKIWLSEIILQQTQVIQGLSYYQRFIEHYPTVADLAAAELDQILLLWQGLGYYSRARNLYAAANQIMERFKGTFPDTYDDILALKGVGEYTASAVASFAFKLPYAVVDGNVFRVLSRIFGIQFPIDTGAGKREFKILADALLDQEYPDMHNQAIMEFGALQCRPKNPDCPVCPFRTECAALKNDLIASLPFKSRKGTVRHRYFHYLKVTCGANIAVEKRPAGDIWAELYQLPLIETSKAVEQSKLEEHTKWKQLFSDKNVQEIECSELITHQLSHQKLHTRFYHIVVKEQPEGLSFIHQDQLKQYAFPQLIYKYLNVNS